MLTVNFPTYASDRYKLITDPAGLGLDADIENKIIENLVEKEISEYDHGEMIEIYDERDLIIHKINDNVDPYIGMAFESEEAAMIYYDVYAKRIGFIMRVGNCHRSSHDGSVISRRFLCNKEGFRVNKKVKRLEVRKPREVTREGCKAMIMVRKEESSKWVVTKFVMEHTHVLGIPAGKGRRGTIQARPQVSRWMSINLSKFSFLFALINFLLVLSLCSMFRLMLFMC